MSASFDLCALAASFHARGIVSKPVAFIAVFCRSAPLIVRESRFVSFLCYMLYPLPCFFQDVGGRVPIRLPVRSRPSLRSHRRTSCPPRALLLPRRRPPDSRGGRPTGVGRCLRGSGATGRAATVCRGSCAPCVATAVAAPLPARLKGATGGGSLGFGAVVHPPSLAAVLDTAMMPRLAPGPSRLTP